MERREAVRVPRACLPAPGSCLLGGLMTGTELPLYSLTEVSFHHFPKHNGDNGYHVEEEM